MPDIMIPEPIAEDSLFKESALSLDKCDFVRAFIVFIDKIDVKYSLRNQSLTFFVVSNKL